ncbi:group 3 secretory phospholipase A2-like isoform X2 [Silurus meridionalis]|uniref:phospholipase A2 n=1 Tax=Silurus meridionalis TaxID=175797 RepID=A0A8T0A780_SILME|nr:group 3 secretory phospholipase A2-like isoform X2 [Silurus meridionalis]KAF7687554.1 hypothetical protein HF521_014782 [Silurus meridionalis]
MDTGVLFHLAHLIALSSALLPDSSTQEIFCFHVKSELGRTQCSFLRRPSAEASVLFYWSIWTADDRVEECSISAEPAVLHNYRSVCNEQSMWDLHKTSPRNINITALFEPDSPCELQSVGRWNLRPQKYLDTAQKYVDTDQNYVDTDQKYVDTDQKYVDTHYHVGSESRKRQKRAWIFPGTLWCGHGSRAGEYEQLGMFERVDRCCREHDHCDHTIRPFTVNFGVFNPTLFTISHCECDRRFKQCLVDINDTVSNMVGYTFFNILNQQCFELIQKRRCTKINWIGINM